LLLQISYTVRLVLTYSALARLCSTGTETSKQASDQTDRGQRLVSLTFIATIDCHS